MQLQRLAAFVRMVKVDTDKAMPRDRGTTERLARLSRQLARYRGTGRFIKLLKLLSTLSQSESALTPHTIHDFDRTLTMHLDPSSVMGAQILWYGFHHRAELAYLHRVLVSDMTFLDVGANQGEFTLFAAKRLRDGRVLAFEPSSIAQRALARNIASNFMRNIQIVPWAIGDLEGEAFLYSPAIEPGVGSVKNEGLHTIYNRWDKPGNTERVPVRTLDGVVETLDLMRVDVVKIDIEGAELPCLRGADSVLRRFKPTVILEVNSSSFYAAGYEIRQVAETLELLSYRTFIADRQGNLKPCDIEALGKRVDSFNVVCIASG